MTSSPPLVVRNPARVCVPAAIGALVLLMFLPPLVLLAVSTPDSLKASLGAAAVLMVGLYFGYSAVSSPFEARLDSEIEIRSLYRRWRYQMSQVRQWHFAIPNGAPTTQSPNTNALLQLWMRDGRHFRGEVTAEEAAWVTACLPHVAITNANGLA